MTVIRPNSISGINSITANGGDINLFRADGTKADVPIVNNITAGVVTATKFVGSGADLTGIDAGTLKHNNNTKAQATANGVTITGGLIPAANNTHDLGASGVAWRNLYVNDAHFSNEGHSNSVDGTWGSWTLQEGENDIFMINNRTGKKFAITMREVS